MFSRYISVCREQKLIDLNWLNRDGYILGCMACGKENCRFCGHDNLPSCEGGQGGGGGGGTTAPSPTSGNVN